jgi:hypothetical protein
MGAKADNANRCTATMNPITGQSCTGMSAALTVAFMNYEEALVFSHPAYFNAFSVFARTLAHLFFLPSFCNFLALVRSF